MGKRGTQPKPTNIKAFMGNPGKRRLNKNEPKYTAEDIECPNWLDVYAQGVWARLAPQLRRFGLLTQGDVDLFTAYCSACSDLRTANYAVQRWLGKHKDTAFEEEEPPPWLNAKRKAESAMLRIGQHFGFTPSSRAGLEVHEGADTDPLDSI